MPKWAHMHSRGAAVPHNPLWPADRDTLYLRVCLLPLSPLGFPLMPCSYCPPPSRSADWLPLPLSCRTCHLPRWRPHTHVINSFSSGLQKYRKFPGGLLHGKEMSVPHCHTLAWIPHYMPHDKGTLNELGEITRCAIIIITPTPGRADDICVGMSTRLYSKALPQVEW